MKVEIYLEDGETPEMADELLEKAIKHKHKHAHSEEFQDELTEELLAEIDEEVKRVVFLGGFEEMMSHLLNDPNANQ
jgi:UDP-N-acetyl-D-mannosaminuronic acid transferase (WecB/TagA/CpsF family)